jgi:hypothetical protein
MKGNGPRKAARSDWGPFQWFRSAEEYSQRGLAQAEHPTIVRPRFMGNKILADYPKGRAKYFLGHAEKLRPAAPQLIPAGISC